MLFIQYSSLLTLPWWGFSVTMRDNAYSKDIYIIKTIYLCACSKIQHAYLKAKNIIKYYLIITCYLRSQLSFFKSTVKTVEESFLLQF